MTNQKGSRNCLEGGLREEMPMKIGVMVMPFKEGGSTGGPGQEGLQGKSLESGDRPPGTRGWGRAIAQKRG